MSVLFFPLIKVELREVVRIMWKKLLIILIFSVITITAQQDNYSSGREDVFVFEHTVDKLFSTSTYRVLRSMDFAFTVGSTFNDAGIENFNGGIGIGLGNFLEFHVRTVPQSFTSLKFRVNESLAGIKIKLLNEGIYLPGFSIGSETNLNKVEYNAEAEYLKNLFPAKQKIFPQRLEFDASVIRFYGVVTKRIFAAVNLNFGISYDISGYSNYVAEFESGKLIEKDFSADKRLNLFGGIDLPVNERTKFLFEVYSSTVFTFKPVSWELSPERKTTVNAGMRTFFNEWFTADYGLTYTDTFKSWEEIQLRASITAFLNLGI